MNVSVGQVVAAVLLPPLGVFLKHGTGRDFWIACALTLIGFLPGLVFSLWIVLRKARDEAPVTV